MSYPPIAHGTPVQTLKNWNSVGWVGATLANRQCGAKGVVVNHHDSHGLTYEVEHSDGSIGHYEAAEVRILTPEEASK